MSVPLLEAIADAIYTFEGDRPMERAYRNRNPGNLRPTDSSQLNDTEGYRVFCSLIDGYAALLVDLHDKVTGENTHGLNLDSTILDLIRVYAPEKDGNKPEIYAAFIAHRLGQVFYAQVKSTDTFRALFELVARQELPGGVTTA